MKYATRFLVVFALLLPYGASARDDFEDRGYWYPFVERFTWRGFDGGKQITKEAGEAAGIGATGEYLLAEDTSLILRLKGDASYGKGNFEEALAPSVKASSKSSRIAARGEMDLGRRFLLREGQVELIPFAGAGYRWSNKHVKAGTGVQGFHETWNSAYTRIGARSAYKFDRQVSALFEAGVKVPVYTSVNSSLSGKSFRPGSQVSFYMEAGVSYEKVRPILYYEGFRYSASAPSGGVEFPRMEGDILGLKVAFEF
ncbi:MAG: hypothetical protein M1377_03885 [Deltaproteobacteria bacterium]|nr:hypothetical protein [Deltaproteobacteria bacterium]